MASVVCVLVKICVSSISLYKLGRILGMASVVCVLVKICVSSISLYKLDTDKLTAPFELAHQFTLVCTVSDSKTVTPKLFQVVTTIYAQITVLF